MQTQKTTSVPAHGTHPTMPKHKFSDPKLLELYLTQTKATDPWLSLILALLSFLIFLYLQ